MAQTHFVKTFRGQRKCQFTPEPTEDNRWPNMCGKAMGDHGLAKQLLGHPFTQAPLTCNFCGKDIEIGMPYKWVRPRAHRAVSGVKRNRHMDCPGWKPSELTSSPHLSGIYSAQETAEAALSVIEIPTTADDASGYTDELQAIGEAMAEELETVAEGYEESGQNIEEGFGHETSQSQELMDKAEEVRGWGEMIQGVSFDEAPPEPDPEEDDEDENDSWLEDWAEDQQNLLTDELYNSPV